MGEIQNYKCPSCGAPLTYKGVSQALHCDSCGNDFSPETLIQLDDVQKESEAASKYNWENYTPRNFDMADSDVLADYNCPSCGAEITGDGNLGATICPYCGNSAIIKKQFQGTLRPDYIIPFKTDKKTAIECFEKAALKAPFLPDEFKDKKRIAEMSGIYIPFWMFDCDCNASISYNAQQVTHWSDSNYNYTKINHFRLFRSGSIGFANVPADGLKKADDAYMEALEPYDYSEAIDFNTSYLSGYLADKYDVSANESINRANERIKNSTVSAFESSIFGYTSIKTESVSINCDNGKIRYSLLPVWMLNIKYMDKMYKYAINGQTGKVVGEYPICKKKKRRFFAKAYGISFVLVLAAVLIYLFLL